MSSHELVGRFSIEELIERELITVHKDGNYGSSYPRNSEFGAVGVPFLTAKLVDDATGRIDFKNAPRLNNAKARKLTFGWIEEGDVLLSHNATVGRVTIVPRLTEPVLIGTSLTCFRLDQTRLLPKYLAAFFQSVDFQNQLAAVMSQTTRNQVPITSQRKLQIEVPRFETQVKIASILGCLDDKIELNRRMNATLGSMAQAIFKSWFIDFDPVHRNAARRAGQASTTSSIPGQSTNFDHLFPDSFEESELGMIPTGWSVRKIDYLLAKERGISVGVMYPGQHDPDGVPLIKAGDFTNSVLNRSPDFRISKAKHREYSRTELRGGETLMTLVGNIGQCAVVPEEMRGWNAARAVAVIRFADLDATPFLVRWLQCPIVKHLIDSWANTTVQATLNLGDIRKLPVLWPCEMIRSKFGTILASNSQLVARNSQYSLTLAAIRMELLPQLLSGELSLQAVEEVSTC